tara:strand:+ start:96 stop:818 length:723 start_codon:yes stop_codon:yes gene_type:complete
MKNKIVIYGGSSQISKFLFLEFYKDDCEFVIFCRNKRKVESHIETLKLDSSRFLVHCVDLEKLEDNLKIINEINYSINGVVWVAGSTGNPEKEIANPDSCKNNYNINLINPILIINQLIPKISDGGFISVITSVAGVRGRSKRLFYCSAKAGLINYLSGLRQMLHKRNILVNTVIPGYMSTDSFTENASKFLIVNPSKAAKIIYKSIKKKKEIVYVGLVWKIISFVIKLIPENIFKKLSF